MIEVDIEGLDQTWVNRFLLERRETVIFCIKKSCGSPLELYTMVDAEHKNLRK